MDRVEGIGAAVAGQQSLVVLVVVAGLREIDLFEEFVEGEVEGSGDPDDGDVVLVLTAGSLNVVLKVHDLVDLVEETLLTVG